MATHQPGRLMWAVLLCALCSCAVGFEWQRDNTLVVNSCLGSTVTIPWKFFKSSDESVGTIHWFRFSKETMASYVDGRITNPDKRFVPSRANADITISDLTVRDSGHYEVSVKVFTKSADGEQSETVYTTSALLVVGDPPSISGERLTIEEVTSNELCALKRQVTLKCGHFISRGVPPIDVVWTDPAGQQLPSSRYVDGKFHLDLPHQPLGGNYTCHALCQSPVLQCLDQDSPILATPQIHRKSPSSRGCSEEDLKDFERLGPISDSKTVQELKSNLSDVQQTLITLQDQQTRLMSGSQEREENFQVKVEELRELVLLSNQESGSAQVQILQQTVIGLQIALHDLQRNFTTLKQQGSGENQKSRQQDDRIQDLVNDLQTLQTKLEANQETLQSLEEKVSTLSIGLTLTESTLASLQDVLNVKVDGHAISEHAQNVSDLQESFNRLEDLNSDVLEQLRQVSQAQKTCEKQQENLTRSLDAVSSRVDGMEGEVKRRVDRAVSQFKESRADLSKLSWRVSKVEKGAAGGGSSGLIVGGGEERALEPAVDPLVSRTEPTFSLSVPWNGQRNSLLHDFVITPDGQVIAADRYNAYVIVAVNVSQSDVITVPLRHGSHIRKLALMPDGVVAATVDDHYILLLDPTTEDDLGHPQQRWIRTPTAYHGIAARSSQTLFVSVVPENGDDIPRVDVISVVDDVISIVSNVLSGSTTSQLKKPVGLTLHGDELYVSDVGSNVILRVSLETLETVQVTVSLGPENLGFLRPYQTVFDVSENMYVTTGGRLCEGMGGAGGGRGDSRSFCVVVVSREGWWDRLIARGRHVLPFGVALTPTGLAVSWGSRGGEGLWRSLIQWYDLVEA